MIVSLAVNKQVVWKNKSFCYLCRRFCHLFESLSFSNYFYFSINKISRMQVVFFKQQPLHVTGKYSYYFHRWNILKLWYSRSSPSEVFLEKSVLKIFSKFTGQHLCRSMILIQLYCNHSSILVFSYKFAAYFWNTYL